MDKAAFKRLVLEHSELEEKHLKLGLFIKSARFDELSGRQKSLLIDQEAAMSAYMVILALRIKDESEFQGGVKIV